MRRAEALDAPALLVDENRSFAAKARARPVDQPAQRVGLGHIALEQDQAPGLRIAQEPRFQFCERRAGEAGNEGTHCRGRLARASHRGQARH
jgi:hypothetical protein